MDQAPTDPRDDAALPYAGLLAEGRVPKPRVAWEMLVFVPFGGIGVLRTVRRWRAQGDPRISQAKARAAVALSVVSIALHAVALVGAAVGLMRLMDETRDGLNRVACSSNLRQIGLALLLYGNENGGAYPARLEVLVAAESMVPDTFTCPSTDDEKAPGNTPQEQAANLTRTTNGKKHVSFVYVGQNLTQSSPPDAVVAHEPLSNHRDRGMNVLFGDGHTEFVERIRAKKLLAELAAGHNPPRKEKIQ